MKALERADRLIAQAQGAAWPGPRVENGDDWYQPSLPRETLIRLRNGDISVRLRGNWIFVLFLSYYINNVPLWVTP
jgi:hypothetical protein